VKVFLDTRVWGKAKEALSRAGHDTEWAGDWDKDPGDEEILRLAHEQARVLVTLDKDFGELAVAFGRPHSGLVRLVGMSAREQGPICAERRACRRRDRDGRARSSSHPTRSEIGRRRGTHDVTLSATPH
jgi:predicted nuclease of predicted toxin-antitoxin system